MYEVCIIGLGKQAFKADIKGSGNEKKIISYAKAFTNHKDYKITTIIDIKQENIDKYTDYYNHDNLYGFEKLDIALLTKNHDIIVVATPDETHFEIMKQIVKFTIQKPKLVICEKPLAMNSKEGRFIVDLYKMMGINILVNYTRRFIPELINLKEKFDKKELGKILDIKIMYNGSDIHTGTHMYDFINWFFEIDIEKEIGADNELYCDVDYRIWNIQMFFEKYYFQEQRIFDMPVPAYFDLSMKYLVDNVHNFMIGEEKLKCTGEEALKSIKIIEKL